MYTYRKLLLTAVVSQR